MSKMTEIIHYMSCAQSCNTIIKEHRYELTGKEHRCIHGGYTLLLAVQCNHLEGSNNLLNSTIPHYYVNVLYNV